MGGHGGSSGLISKAKQAKIKAEADAVSSKLAKGEIGLGEAIKEKKAIASKYGIDNKTLSEIQWGDYASQAAELKKSVDEKKGQAAQTSVTSGAKNLAGINGNPWPPDADKNHLPYQGGGGLGIWNQFGGGVQNGGVSSATAKEMHSAVASFTGIGYGSIRAAQESGNTTSAAGKKGVLCEQFIQSAVSSGNAWEGGPTYRGIDDISTSAFNAYANLKKGDSVDPNMGGTASWSTHKNTSFESFSGGPNSVVFVHLGNKQPKGVSVDSISTCKGEKEVLVSKDAKYKVSHVANYTGDGDVGYKNTKYLLVYVEDA